MLGLFSKPSTLSFPPSNFYPLAWSPGLSPHFPVPISFSQSLHHPPHSLCWSHSDPYLLFCELSRLLTTGLCTCCSFCLGCFSLCHFSQVSAHLPPHHRDFSDQLLKHSLLTVGPFTCLIFFITLITLCYTLYL